jgi:hypothetical protein
MGTVSMFLYGFPEGQEALLNTWTRGRLVQLFDTSPSVLHFFLCLTFRNELMQAMFVQTSQSTSLFDILFNAFDSARSSPPLLLVLIAQLVNSEEVRQSLYRKKKISKLVLRLSYAVDHHDIPLCDGMLRIIATLAYYEDGRQGIFSQAHAMDVFMKMLVANEVFENDVFQLLMNNLRTVPWAWKALTSAARQIGREAHERMSLFIEKRRGSAAERQNAEVNV